MSLLMKLEEFLDQLEWNERQMNLKIKEFKELKNFSMTNNW